MEARRAVSILFIAFILLAGHRASGQESGGLIGKKKGSKPQSEMDTTITHTCGWLFADGLSANTNQLWQISYDTLMKFIDSCPTFPQSWEAFSTMSGDVQFFLNGNFIDDSVIEAQYRNWLYSVIYMDNADPAYFCQCIQQIAGTFSFMKPDTSEQVTFEDDNVSIAIDRWIMQNPKCDSAAEWANWQSFRRIQLEQYNRDKNSGINYPYDTTIPTLSQIGYGLDTLPAKYAFYASVSNPSAPNIITSITASPNPVSIGTEITFGISQEAYVKIGLFDILGHEVTSPGYEGLFAPGNHEVPLSLQSLPSGTYFARILTAYGSVATVKLVKE